MQWILIVILWSNNGQMTSFSQEFDDEPACRAAQSMIQETNTDWMSRKLDCLPKSTASSK
jgi:hypothetical protein